MRERAPILLWYVRQRAFSHSGIETGVSDELLDVLARLVAAEVKQRFDYMLHLQRHAHESIAAAMAYVDAMLGLQVYAHTLYQSIKAEPHVSDHEHG